MKCNYCDRDCKNPNSLRNHERLCRQNPNRQESSWKIHHARLLCGESTSWNKGLTKDDPRIAQASAKIATTLRGRKNPPLSSEHKASIAASMRLAHANGKAWNIGKSRWNNKRSWPEIFFEMVVMNEFDDKNYVQEYPLSIYSLDFAWLHKRRCIEIDGEQHERFVEYQERDTRKNAVIEAAGWEILRIKWVEMYRDTKYWIRIAKEFIDAVEASR